MMWAIPSTERLVMEPANTFMDSLNNVIDQIDGFVWGPTLLIPLLFVTGLVLTIRLGGLQFRKLGPALRLGLIERKDPGAEGDVSHYQALTTALAATVGVGNIVGVATAIGIGGPGALFWMWVTGLLGMASKYAEAFLGSKYRATDPKGEQIGGPQVYLERAIKGRVGKVLAITFAIFGALAAFGIGNMTQVNAVVTNIHDAFDIGAKWHWVSGLVIMVLVGSVLIGGIKWIGRVTAGLVPFMIVVYLVAGLVILALNVTEIPGALGSVFTNAFTGTAETGGFAGAGIAWAIRYGMARGIFSNESGMGSAAIVAAAAKTTHPVRQGLVSMTQTFIDTIIVVSFTGLVILSTGVWEHPNLDPDTGAPLVGALTGQAAGETIAGSFGPIVVAVCVAFFALSTILGWSYYGERCAVRLLGIGAQMPYRVVFTLMIMAGALWELNTIWNVADILNGLMALPNLVGLLILSGLIARETKAYLDKDPKLLKGDVKMEELVAIDVKWVPAPKIRIR
ncbi:MAG: sodium:alanine symporter family protein [Bifidobacteriaceae bacterium]|jgi:AGCS family alanine or glycine:cation symporter|nr:sodium:alanine symporter family protein [Bifidobacteriaceae bacterium]